MALVLAVMGTAASAAPALASARPIGDCTTTSGVIVAVDFGHWGGPVLRSCGTTPTTGYDLLNQGGWRTTGTEHDGPGFICRIGYAGYRGGTQYPTPSQESCVLTPPTDAYWAFWYANPGQNGWSYSQTGATGIQPEPGSVELWVFGGTNVGGTSGSAVPAVAPAALRAENTRPAGIAHRHARPASRQSTAPAQATSQAAAPATPSSKTTAAASADPSVKATIVNAPPSAASAAPVNHGSAAPAIIALVIVLVLAAIGITVVLRRPRRDQ